MTTETSCAISLFWEESNLMDILEVVRSDLKDATMERQHAVAVGSGVPWSTLRKIVDGDTTNPRYDTVRALVDYYARNPPSANAAADVRA